MPDAQTWIDVGGVRYAYADTGCGASVLFGHGLSCDRHLFDAQVKALAEGYRCVSFDWPGHGESDYRRGGWTLDDLAADTIVIVEALGLAPAVLVGLSQGGMAFARVAARRPELVRALVLVDTTARAEEAGRAEALVQNSRRIAAATDTERVTFYRDFALPAFFSRGWLDANPAAAEVELRRRLEHDRTGYQLAVQAVATRAAMHDLVASISVPTLVVVGEVDTLTPADHARELHDLIPASRLAVIPAAGHHTPLEQPAMVTQLLADFLAGL